MPNRKFDRRRNGNGHPGKMILQDTQGRLDRAKWRMIKAQDISSGGSLPMANVVK
jgi:hypothetical protein